MKIIYIAPENTVGTLSLWKQAHKKRGNSCDYFTLYPSKSGFDQGVCLHLPLISPQSFYTETRHRYYRRVRGPRGDYTEKDGHPPVWTPHSRWEALYFRFRDWVWHFKIEPVIDRYRLQEADIIHLEWGLEFYRDGRFVRRLAELGTHIVCTYHGQDLRTRGVIPAIDAVSELNLTSELDLLSKHPDLHYLFLPFDTGKFEPKLEVNQPIRICHSPTNRYYKGSETIIPVCERITREEANVEFILIENQPYDRVLEIKQSCDILVDQIYNRGGWGYGMNSVEALAMGLCCVTELVPEYEDFIPGHPFVNVNEHNLYDRLKALVNNPGELQAHRRRSREWVVKTHDIDNVAHRLYEYYTERGFLD